MNMISYKYVSFSLSDVKYYYSRYVKFLKYKTNLTYLLLIINHNISKIPFDLDIKLNNYKILDIIVILIYVILFTKIGVYMMMIIISAIPFYLIY